MGNKQRSMYNEQVIQYERTNLTSINQKNIKQISNHLESR